MDVWSAYVSELPMAEFVEEAISLTNDYKGHYKNRLGIWRYWYDFHMEKVGVTSEFRNGI